MASTTTATLHCPNCGGPAAPDAQRCAYCRSRLATVSCPGCFGLMFAGAAFCSHCGSRASRVDDPAVMMACARCGARMTRAAVGPVSFAECGACDGIWMDADVFEQLCADREAQAAVLHRVEPVVARTDVVQSGAIRYRPCPRCRKLMNRFNFGRSSGVVLDVCRGHGTLFDRGELHRVVTFIRQGGLDIAREQERDTLREEQRRLRALRDAPVRTPSPTTTEVDTLGRFLSALLRRD